MPKAKPKEITQEEYDEVSIRLLSLAALLARKKSLHLDYSFWLSSCINPCSGLPKGYQSLRTSKGIYTLKHFTKIPCGEYCTEKLPMATCLTITREPDNPLKFHYWLCRHKVGNCPWKRY